MESIESLGPSFFDKCLIVPSLVAYGFEAVLLFRYHRLVKTSWLHHHLSLKRDGRWGATDVTTSFLHFSLFSTALWDLPNSRPVHSLM